MKDAFPPSANPGPPSGVNSGALEIVRYAPEGDVELAPYLSVTFNQPMVAVSSHAEAVKNLPVTLSPQPAGSWRWIGTKTLLFDPDIRFPQATEYRVEVRAGVKSAAGNVLAAGKSFIDLSVPPDSRQDKIGK